MTTIIYWIAGLAGYIALFFFIAKFIGFTSSYEYLDEDPQNKEE
jgi:uncharacterized membrane protein YuzA (DUF378 family)